MFSVYKPCSLVLALCLLLLPHALYAQNDPGILAGTVLDEKGKAAENASVELLKTGDTLAAKKILTDKNGFFTLNNIVFGLYKLKISFIGYQTLVLDSIHFRKERFDFNLNDIVLKLKSPESLEEVVVYAEKPLIQTKDGNITFNAGESALSAGSNANDLLTNVPLVSKDASGKITVRGKEPKILIDDKPVELNMQQLQDLLESMPGSAVEKIEVMTNPPPQYAGEQGGVINITTRKGRVGINGRLNAHSGSRGEYGINGTLTYRKQGLAVSLNAAGGFSRFAGNGYSVRNNIYTDSSNFFNTQNDYLNKNIRPSLRLNTDYDFNKLQSINIVFTYNRNDFDNNSITEYRNINRFNETWRLSRREVGSEGFGDNYGMSIGYTAKTKKPGEVWKVIAGYNYSLNDNDRLFYQQFFTPDYIPNGIDSLQEQLYQTRINSYSLRLDYTRMLKNKKTFLSGGGFLNRSNNNVLSDATYKKKPEGIMLKLDQLSNHFIFHQTVGNLRASVRQLIGENFSITAGASVEETSIWFELLKEDRDARNSYYTFLPFGNINKSWKEKLNLTFAYRRTIRRPGIGELNPTIDFSDPYNIRFGNEKLEASTADNFDFIIGRTRPLYYLNLGMGYNIVRDVFSTVRTLLPDGKTQVTWENISGRHEYEISSWNGYTLSKKLRVNLSASYTYNKYSVFDRTVRKFRNGGSFTSNLNTHYTPKDVWMITGNFTLNRFANPQGSVRWNTSMNMGVQRKLLAKKLFITVNIIDPFRNQQNKSYTYGPNFNLESFSTTRTRNYRISVAYNFSKNVKKKGVTKTVKAKTKAG